VQTLGWVAVVLAAVALYAVLMRWVLPRFWIAT